MTSLDPEIGVPVPGEQPSYMAPGPRELRADAWTEYFRWLERQRDDLSAVVEVVRDSALEGNGAQRPLREIRYDGRLGLLELAAGPAAAGELPVRYFICDPRVIRVLESAELTAILVEDARRVRTLIRLYPGWGSLQEGSSFGSNLATVNGAEAGEPRSRSQQCKSG